MNSQSQVVGNVSKKIYSCTCRATNKQLSMIIDSADSNIVCNFPAWGIVTLWVTDNSVGLERSTS